MPKKKEEVVEKVEEEEEPEPEPEPELEPFDDLMRIWKLEGETQRKEVALLFDMELDPVHYGTRTIKVDHVCDHLNFARKSGFTRAQTQHFYNMMTTLYDMLKDKDSTVQSLYAKMKELIVLSSQISNVDSSNSEKYTSMYTLGNIMQIKDYMVSGVLGNFNLFKAVYCSEYFTEGTITVPMPVVISTVLSDPVHMLHLVDARPVSDIEREIAERLAEEERQRQEQLALEEEEKRKKEEELAEIRRLEEEEAARRAATPIRQVKEGHGNYINQNLKFFSDEVGQEIDLKTQDLEQKMKNIELLLQEKKGET